MASLCIVHLTDLHFGDPKTPDCWPESKTLLSCIRGQCSSKEVLLAFSGDLAYSGKDQEFAYILEQLENLVRSLREDGFNVYCAFAPGNHDVDLTLPEYRTEAIPSFRKNYNYKLQEATGFLQSLQTFFSFDYLFTQLEWVNCAYQTQIIRVGEQRIQVTCLNTSTFCSKSNDIGQLKLPTLDLPPRLPEVSTHICIMHHPLHWLEDECKRVTVNWIARNCEVVLTGHEHYPEQMELMYAEFPATSYLPGVPLSCEYADCEGFQVLELELVNRSLTVKHLVKSKGNFTATQISTRSLANPEKRAGGLLLQEAFLEKLDELNVAITHPNGSRLKHSSIFVSPHLALQEKLGTSSDPSNITQIDAENLSDQILLHEEILIVGEEYSGKTFLLKHLFSNLRKKGLNPVQISAKQLSRYGFKKALEEAILHTYKVQDVSEYFALPRKDRVLLVDDIDLAIDRSSGVNSHLLQARDGFPHIALTCRDVGLLTDPLRDSSENNLWSIRICRILPFGHQKRSELINRWLSHDRDLSETQVTRYSAELELKLNSIIALKALPANPLNLSFLLESMGYGEHVDESTGAYGYHIQRLILQAIQRAKQTITKNLAGRVHEDFAHTVLAQLAKTLWSTRLESISSDQLDSIEELLTVRHLHRIKLADYLLLLERAELIKRVGSEVQFSHRYVYEFSLAKYLERWIDDTEESAECREIINHLISNMQIQSFASILIYFTFLKSDATTISDIVSHADDVFKDFPESNYGDELDAMCDRIGGLSLPVLDKSMSSGLTTEEKLLDRDRQREANDALMSLAREQKDQFVGEFDDAVQCISLLGQVLKAYPTRLKSKQKVTVANAAYRLGFRVQTRFLSAISAEEKLVRDYFKKISEGIDYYPIHGLSRDEQIQRNVEAYVKMSAYSTIQRIARAVGSVELGDLYKNIEIENCEVPVKLVNKAISFGFMHDLQQTDSISFYQKMLASNQKVAASVLRQLVWEFMLMKAIPGNQRSGLLSSFEFRDHPMLIARSNKVSSSVAPFIADPVRREQAKRRRRNRQK